MDTINTIASPLAIIALVNVAKRLGMPAALSPVLALILAGAIVLAELWLSPEGYGALSRAILLGLAAAGLWDITPGSVGPQSPKRAVDNQDELW